VNVSFIFFDYTLYLRGNIKKESNNCIQITVKLKAK